ncbi:MAG: hypothetical protein JOY90_27150 [Bradyrhizobium sp.]|uniref:hypothetical protein n=1 Tax=Bradyrhizobium sp. TaxID=376 RepID=UPI001D612FF8|nr:hypothetical protein [Bradyrhizobium sp.]MBV9564092.1 hypothetical protein [Bradyrhizobium sp.]
MAGRPIEFGKRGQTHLPPAPGPKRSHHVALLLMGSFAVGGTAYAVMPREACAPPSPGMAAPALPQSGVACTSRSSSGGYSRSRYGFFSGGDSSHASASSSDAGEGHVSRGGFGSFARAFGFSGRS